ncbi:MAG: ribonuclease HII [Gammaproteobacteria bacterium]|nr:ribonuclease HII [Gammaproteobacteria bacterium]MDH3372755.1 ribonuclease HII [Gammaproteobacteria bacterium]MDH3410321.1 ribonuclease HII [Gammaproteobacteria bacterium]
MQQSKLFEFAEPVAGVDEAGRGPLAGPVVAAAVILGPGHLLHGLADSKKLSANRREELAGEIRANALAWSVAWSDAAEIDALNILAATMLAMRRAILGLSIMPTRVQVDGNRLPDLQIGDKQLRGEAIIGGDAKIPAISAASIIAKTTRDQIMVRMDSLYPHYEFAKHKGYGTEIHRARLQEHGPCEQHRRSFAPVRRAG